MLRTPTLLCMSTLASFLLASTAVCQESPQAHQQLAHLLTKLQALCSNGDVPGIESLFAKDEAVKLLIKEDPTSYGEFVSSTIRELTASPLGRTTDGSHVVAEIAMEFAATDFEKPSPELLGKQLDVFLTVFQAEAVDRKLLEEDRVKRLRAMLVLWRRIHSLRMKYSRYDPYIPNPALVPYAPPESYKGPFMYGGPPEQITDRRVRAEYAAYLRERAHFMAGSRLFDQVKTTHERFKKRASPMAVKWQKGKSDRAEIHDLLREVTPKSEFDEALVDAFLEDVKAQTH
jgi:hypothetical protein